MKDSKRIYLVVVVTVERMFHIFAVFYELKALSLEVVRCWRQRRKRARHKIKEEDTERRARSPNHNENYIRESAKKRRKCGKSPSNLSFFFFFPHASVSYVLQLERKMCSFASFFFLLVIIRSTEKQIATAREQIRLFLYRNFSLFLVELRCFKGE